MFADLKSTPSIDSPVVSLAQIRVSFGQGESPGSDWKNTSPSHQLVSSVRYPGYLYTSRLLKITSPSPSPSVSPVRYPGYVYTSVRVTYIHPGYFTRPLPPNTQEMGTAEGTAQTQLDYFSNFKAFFMTMRTLSIKYVSLVNIEWLLVVIMGHKSLFGNFGHSGAILGQW